MHINCRVSNLWVKLSHYPKPQHKRNSFYYCYPKKNSPFSAMIICSIFYDSFFFVSDAGVKMALRAWPLTLYLELCRSREVTLLFCTFCGIKTFHRNCNHETDTQFEAPDCRVSRNETFTVRSFKNGTFRKTVFNLRERERGMREGN